MLLHDYFLAVYDVDATFLWCGHFLALQGVDRGGAVSYFGQGDACCIIVTAFVFLPTIIVIIWCPAFGLLLLLLAIW